MKFLFVARNPSLFFQYERVIGRLIDKGHSIELHLDSMQWRNGRIDAEILKEYQAETNGRFSYKPAVRPSGFGTSLLRHKREILNYAAYLRDDHPISTSPYMIERQCQALYPPMNILMRNRLLKYLVLRKDRLRWLSVLEDLVRPSKAILHVIQKSKADLVLASPFIFTRSIVELEYIKCACSLKIPTSVPIFSWDNLTSKGIFQIIPDTILVWNEMQKKELREIHNIFPEKVFLTGAPSLDFWFEQKPKQEFAEFCRAYSLQSDRPFIVYLCSSQTIARNEHVFVKKIVQQMKKLMGDHCPSILIRPHPLNVEIWKNWNEAGTVVVPKSSRDIFYSKEAKAFFFETLYHSSCVLGLNTTAMVEVAIVDKPCVSILCEEYRDTQEKSGHFHHLTDAGFIFTTRSMDDVSQYLKSVMNGQDPHKKARQRFVTSFIRPCGIEQQSSEVMATKLETLAKGKPEPA